LYQYTDNSSNPNQTYYILAKTSASTNYWGTYFFNQNANRQNLIIQAPHPVYDTYTGAQAFHIFREVGARSLFIAGAHRCNSTLPTTCDGTSSVCTGSSAAFRISDQAHSDEGFFQRGTETLDGLITDIIVIQIHGFGKLETDPDVIISNGTKHSPSETDYASLIKTNLLAEDNSLTFKIPHIDTDWDRLTGTTNTQGRYINESGDPCETAPVSATGRFIHIEQKKDGLRNPSSDWSKITNAIANSISLNPLPVQFNRFESSANEHGVTLHWQTSTEVNNYGFEIERSSVKTEVSPSNNFFMKSDWDRIGFVQGSGNSNSPKDYYFTDNLAYSHNPINFRLHYRLKQIDFDGQFEYSEIIEVILKNNFNMSLNQNYPNPFNPSTVISYQIPTAGHVTLKVFDILGREVATLVDEYKQPGSYSSLFSPATGGQALRSSLSSSVYFYRLSSANYVETKKMLLLR
jgi:hypothetical protein